MKRVPVDSDDEDAWPPGVKDSEGRCVVVCQGMDWEVPSEGVVKMVVQFDRQPASHAHISTTHGFGNMIEVWNLSLQVASCSLRIATAVLIVCLMTQLMQHRDLNAKSRVQLVQIASDDADLSCRQVRDPLSVACIHVFAPMRMTCCCHRQRRYCT